MHSCLSSNFVMLFKLTASSLMGAMFDVLDFRSRRDHILSLCGNFIFQDSVALAHVNKTCGG